MQKKAVQGAKWIGIQQVFSNAIGFLIFLVLARLLSPGDFGLVAFAGVFIAFIGPFIRQGFASAIIQRQELEAEHLNTAFWASLGIAAAAAGIMIIGAEQIAKLFGMPALAPVLKWLSLSFIFTALSGVQEALLNRKFGFKSLALRSLVGQLAGGAIGLVMALLDYGVWSLVARQLVSSFVSVFLLWRISDWRPGLNFSTQHFRELFNFGIHMSAGEFLLFFNRRFDDFLIGYFLGPVALGYYSVAYRLLRMMAHLFNGTVRRVALPTYARMQNEPERLQRAFLKVTQIGGLIAFPAFFGVFAIVPEFVVAVFGEKWVPSIPVMQILTIVGLLGCLISAKAVLLVAVGKPDLRLKLMFVSTIANVIGFLIAVRWGIVAVAASYAIVQFFMVPLWFFAIKKLGGINMRSYLLQYVSPGLAAIAMLACIFALKASLNNSIGPGMFLVISVPSGALVYFVTIRLLSPSLAKEIWRIVGSMFYRAKAVDT